MTQFHRPVFILAPPRSGSTLVFETLSRSQSLWTLGDEGHGIIERHASLTPRPATADSNRLLAADLAPELAVQIRADFLSGVRNSRGAALPQESVSPVRLLEKTPKNILRIPFFLQLFPDARFIYLYRDARENISSIMEGWQSGRFSTYRDKQTRHGLWSFLLPPGWQRYTGAPLAEIAAFQWAACHDYAMQDLATLPADRWCALNYQEFLTDTEAAVTRLCVFMDVAMDDELRSHCRSELPLSRYTLSAPGRDKWRQNAAALAPLMDKAARMSQRINRFTRGQSPALATALAIDLPNQSPAPGIGRNQPCSCGSGKKYKHCHGRL